jgi:predicted acylesterase/phospholipase RssA
MELVNKLIVDPIQEEMRASGVSRKIWENVECNSVDVNWDGGIYINIHSEYFSDSGFDVAVAREEGTEDHWIRPKNKKALSWISGGKRRFSGGHEVSGLPKLNIIQKIIDRNEFELKEKLDEEYIKWRNSIFQDE